MKFSENSPSIEVSEQFFFLKNEVKIMISPPSKRTLKID